MAGHLHRLRGLVTCDVPSLTDHVEIQRAASRLMERRDAGDLLLEGSRCR